MSTSLRAVVIERDATSRAIARKDLTLPASATLSFSDDQRGVFITHKVSTYLAQDVKELLIELTPGHHMTIS